ncbi:aromatic amino acid hydroxylase [Sphingobacterium spiritivorum]|uniref:aromatic amino acid hydroxylase n=1 Tax=Sphingobacterium spiritivorum TaxID=258 RepID=UPI003DA28DE1
MDTYNNPILEQLPAHLKKYVVPQQYERYTPVDQAIWRYVMRQNYAYLKDVAYYPYIPGLKKAGLTIERIPDLQAMNDSLKQIGWGAATVDGFIPPSAFMEFQAHRVLVIAADIRQLEHIEYTPAPDIIHESSGHAPIIGEPEYAEYLQYFGEIGAKAMFSAQDFALYEAIRSLSIIKEKNNATINEIEEAELHLKNIQENMGDPSEMALLSRLHWWTVEYGLIGTPDVPKIYGAGLLSSIGESASCMRKEIPKLPYSLDALNYAYDITQPQPQLFVTPDFVHLRNVLDDFANTMAFRIGGKDSLYKAIACQNVCTVVYSSGLQVSGIFQKANDDHALSYIKSAGPTALSCQNKQLEGHGKSYHRDGFGSPVGLLKDSDVALEDFTDEELVKYDIVVGRETVLTFASGIEVRGVVQSVLRQHGKLILVSMAPCQVVEIESCQLYFDPEWGTYDMAVGKEIVSVYCGAADKDAFEQESTVSEIKTVHQVYDEQTITLHQIYAHIRKERESKASLQTLTGLYAELSDHYPDDWLGLLEILEIATKEQWVDLASSAEGTLLKLQEKHVHLIKLIHDGIRLAKDDHVGILLTE